MWHPGMHANMNFPALLAALGIGVAFVGTVFAVCVLMISLITRQRKIVRVTIKLFATCAVIYLLFVFSFSLGSRDVLLARGVEKYFCEADCHLAYSVTDVKRQPTPVGIRYTVTLRTRFDETTIASWRPRDVPLRPSPRTVQLVDGKGRRFTPGSLSGTPLTTDLIPGQSYTTELGFSLPLDAEDLRLLIGTVAAWPDNLVIGGENSWLHKKTYLAI